MENYTQKLCASLRLAIETLERDRDGIDCTLQVLREKLQKIEKECASQLSKGQCE